MKGQKSRNIWIAVIVLIIVVVLFLYLNLSTRNISEIKTEDNIGKTVKVRGEVKTVIKIGELSGYTIEDESGSVAVSSKELPKEGQTVTVRGTLIRDTIFGYYVKVN